MSDIIEVELDDANRILIPPDVQKRLGLAPGMTLVVEQEQGGGVALHIQPEVPMLVDQGGVLVATVELVEDIADIVRQERDLRALDRSQRERV